MNKNYLLEDAVIAAASKPLLTCEQEGKITLPKFELNDGTIAFSELNQLQQEFIKFCQSIIEQGQVTTEELFELEHEIFMKLCRNPKTITKLP